MKKGTTNLLLVDNQDSFTYNIRDYLSRLGAQVQVLDRDSVSIQHIEESDGVVFSPGPGNPERLTSLLDLIGQAVARKPVLGICLGHQALAYYFGAEIRQANPMHGKISKVHKVNDSSLLNQIPDSFSVVRYHSLYVDSIPDDLIPILQTEDSILMAFQHQNLPVFGIQFHPEAHLSEFGLDMLRNWLNMC